MKRWLASIFRWLEDLLDPIRRNEMATLAAERAEIRKDFARLLDQAHALRDEVFDLRAEKTPLPIVSTDWTNELRAGLIDFLRSGSGKAMLARGRLIQHQLLVGTDQNAGDPQAAKSWCQCLDWLESLSRASARSTEVTDPETESPDHDTPRPGETALRERMSP